MKRLMLGPFVILIVLLAGIAAAQSGLYFLQPTWPTYSGTPGKRAYNITASDTALTPSTWQIVYRDSFIQVNETLTNRPFPGITGALAQSDSLRVYSTNAADSTQHMTIYGVTTTDSSNVSKFVHLSGTDTAYVASVKWLRFERAIMDTVARGTVTIATKRGGPVSIINPGKYGTDAAFHFTGRGGCVVDRWAVSADTVYSVLAALDFFPAFSVTNAITYDQLRLQPKVDQQGNNVPINVPGGGMVAIRVKAPAAADINGVLLQVTDK